MRIFELTYSRTNTYLAEGDRGRLLIDTGWAGTFPAFCRALGELGIPVQSLDYILITHFHPDHMGIAQEIAKLGPVIAVMDVQAAYLHAADEILKKDAGKRFLPIRDEQVRRVALRESRAFLNELGIRGEILHTPGHSDDSISLCLDDGTFFVGDLNPLYELELHRGTQIADSWEKLLARQPKTICYGHAKKAVLSKDVPEDSSGKAEPVRENQRGDYRELTEKIMKYVEKGVSLEKIRKKTGADAEFIEDVARMTVTHPGVSVQGILDRIEIKNR